jgi:hypothetical protein
MSLGSAVCARVLPEGQAREPMTSDLSVIAAQLIEAAYKARDGEREAAGEHIAHAVALLHGKRSIGDGYDLLIKCLRTGTECGLRMVFVDGEPQIFPLLENLYHAPATYRSLSRREACVLQMIARGMSRLPRFLYDYIIGGSFQENSLRANIAELQATLLRQRVMVDESHLNLSIHL